MKTLQCFFCKSWMSQSFAEKRMGAGGQLGITTMEMSSSCGWPVGLAAAWPDLIMIMLYGGISSCSVRWSEHCKFCYLGGFFLLPSFPNKTPWHLDISKTFTSIERRRKLLFLPSSSTSLLLPSSTQWWSCCRHLQAQSVIVVHIFPWITVTGCFLLDNHGITHTILDNSGWQVNVEVITIHFLIPILMFESSVDLLTTHHSSHFFSLSFTSVCSLSHAGQLHNRSILPPVPLPVNYSDRPLSS